MRVSRRFYEMGNYFVSVLIFGVLWAVIFVALKVHNIYEKWERKASVR